MKKYVVAIIGLLVLGGLGFALRGNQPSTRNTEPYVTPSDWVEPPSMINPVTDKYTEVNVGGSVVLTVQDAEKWTAKIKNKRLLEFVPGVDHGTFETYPGFTALAEGRTSVVVSDGDGNEYTVTVLIRAKGVQLWGPANLAYEISLAVIGKSENDAISLIERKGPELAYRVTKRDGEALAVTQDYRVDRINLEIENGIVVATNVG
jgi:hypothetical protein